MKLCRPVIWSRVARAFSIALFAATASCGMLIGIEDLNPGGGPDGAGGASGADASLDRAGAGGSGGNGGGSGSGGAGLDVNVDPPGDTSFPGADVSDARADGGSDGRAPDAINDATVAEMSPPDGGVPDRSADAGIAGDTADSSVPPDTAGPDGGSPDVGPDAPVVDAGPDQPPTLTVTGRIIDYWRHPVPSVLVMIGPISVTTNVNGQFTVSGVTPPYDVLFTISTIQANTPAKYGWIYKGLTRSDPTLQVGRAFPERSASTLNIGVTSIDFANLPANHTVHTSFGGVDGSFDTDITGTPTPHLYASWFGPTTTSMTGHALHWTRASSTTLDLPTGYSGYDTQSVALVDANVANISFALPNSSISTGTLAGTVTASMSGGQRENSVFLRFADNAIMQLASDASQPTTFSYMTPAIAQSTLTVAAAQGYWSTPPYSVVHKDGLPATQSGITLQIPDAPSLVAPAAGTTGVNQSTVFRWSGTAKVFMWAISFNAEYKGFFVVTSEKQGQIATMPDGPALAPNAGYSWWVETHGSYQSVDEATASDGMLDSFRFGVLWGAMRGDGSYTSSEENSFTSAP